MSWYAVFHDGDERPVALFRHPHHAMEWGDAHAGRVAAGAVWIRWPAKQDTVDEADGLDPYRAR